MFVEHRHEIHVRRLAERDPSIFWERSPDVEQRITGHTFVYVRTVTVWLRAFYASGDRTVKAGGHAQMSAAITT